MKKKLKSKRIRINQEIRSPEVRVVDPEEGNLGVLDTEKALQMAEEKGLDLVEISPKAQPPIVKIIDYGKYQYEESKKQKESKAKAHQAETKTIQVKVGTSEHDLLIKAKTASKWLKDGHRIKVDLFLPGRLKYMDQNFLKERMQRFLNLISENYKVAQDYKKSPKGLTLVIEKDKDK